MTTREQCSAVFEARVVIEAIRGETLSQLGSLFKVHPIQIATWRKSALDQLTGAFVDGRMRKGTVTVENGNSAIYEEIGRLKVELGWFKKKSWRARLKSCGQRWIGLTPISAGGGNELLGVSRSGLYYQPQGESKENLRLMRLLNEQNTRAPFYGEPENGGLAGNTRF
jgi:hypothetical protein